MSKNKRKYFDNDSESPNPDKKSRSNESCQSCLSCRSSQSPSPNCSRSRSISSSSNDKKEVCIDCGYKDYRCSRYWACDLCGLTLLDYLMAVPCSCRFTLGPCIICINCISSERCRNGTFHGNTGVWILISENVWIWCPTNGEKEPEGRPGP